MASVWYYGYGKKRFGPVTTNELRELAEAGRIQPADTIWREGSELGVLANEVKGLFGASERSEAALANREDRSSPAMLVPDLPQFAAPEEKKIVIDANAAAGSTSDVNLPAIVEDLPSVVEEPPPAKIASEKKPTPTPHTSPVRKGRVTSIRGALVVSQDGSTVMYRKKCDHCGTPDNNTNRMPIRNGITRVTYFCKTCRKMRPVEIQGSV